MASLNRPDLAILHAKPGHAEVSWLGFTTGLEACPLFILDLQRIKDFGKRRRHCNLWKMQIHAIVFLILTILCL